MNLRCFCCFSGSYCGIFVYFDESRVIIHHLEPSRRLISLSNSYFTVLVRVVFFTDFFRMNLRWFLLCFPILIMEIFVCFDE